MITSLDDELAVLLKDKPLALNYLDKCAKYYHALDDLIDEEKNTEIVKNLSSLALTVYNHPYWVQNKEALFLVDRIIRCQYFDSVLWEHSPEEFLRREAKALSHCGINMVFAVVLLELGEAQLDKISASWREYCHKQHLQDKI